MTIFNSIYRCITRIWMNILLIFFLSFVFLYELVSFCNKSFILISHKFINPIENFEYTNKDSSARLNYLGNKIKNRLDSEFEKPLLENYWNGNGNIELTSLRFEEIKQYLLNVVDFRHVKGFEVILSDGTKGKAFIVSFYGSKEYGHAFGTATVYTNDNYEIVGFKDYYDFDFRPFGERSFKAEAISRIIKGVSPKKAKPFNITYGLQYRAPIYDKFLRITDAKHC